MKAIVVKEPGGPEMLQYRDVEDPVPQSGEVLLDVAATAVNRADVLQRQGFYPPPRGASPYLGLECTGTIAALGPDVGGWRVGDQVCALLAGGGYAERVAVPATQLMPVPAGIALRDAAALPEAACTVYSNLIDVAALSPGATLLLHGGSSGIGTMAIQLAKAWGARVVATVGSEAKAAACRELGCDLTVNYRDEDFVARVRETYGGADVVLDIIGARYLARNVEVLKIGGIIVVIGLQGGRKAELDLGLLIHRQGRLATTSLRFKSAEQKAAVTRSVADKVWPLIAEHKVKPVIDTVLPLAQAAEAHRRLETSEHIGKILLTV